MIIDNIKKFAGEKGWSIARLEREANVANGTIRKWENGSPRVSFLQKVADALGVPIEELLKK